MKRLRGDMVEVAPYGAAFITFSPPALSSTSGGCALVEEVGEVPRQPCATSSKERGLRYANVKRVATLVFLKASRYSARG
jgi:hypothetical protein